MPGSWSDDDGFGQGDPSDDDVERGDDEVDAPLAGPVHPDDRLWRHPSELAWGVPPPSALPSTAAAAVGASPNAGPGGRMWGLALTSALTGAALALGLVALFAGIGGEGADRVVERIGVRDRLADPMVADTTEGVVAVAESVIPSVVRLEVRSEGGEAVGSGVVVLDDGHIVTNAHVVEGASRVTIVLADGTAVPGVVVGADPVTDVAVVAPDDHAPGVDELTWVPAVRGPASELVIGEPAVAVGSALGLAGAPSVTLGVVSALGRRVDMVGGGVLHGMIQTDAPVGEGSSGGALCDRAGRVVGITTSRYSDTTASIGFATPMEAAWTIAEALMADGVVHHVWLGIEGSDLDATRSAVLGFAPASGAGGVVVERVLPDTPAAAAGLQAGDVLVHLDGLRLTSMSDLVLALRSYRPGQPATIEVHRNGEPRSIDVTLTERPTTDD